MIHNNTLRYLIGASMGFFIDKSIQLGFSIFNIGMMVPLLLVIFLDFKSKKKDDYTAQSGGSPTKDKKR